MQIYQNMLSLNCGKIFQIELPNELSKYNPPINLASLKVCTRNIEKSCILINYSQNLAFSIFDFNPELILFYRLIRKSDDTGRISILEQWKYMASEVIPTIVQEVNTIEPLVLNYCDCLDNHCFEESVTYIFQITEVITQNTTYHILDQEISGIISCRE